MQINIIRNAGPVTPRQYGRPKGGDKRSIYPFHQMEVGDAFDVIGETAYPGSMRFKEWNRVSASAWHHSRATGKKFATRRVDDTILRVWRVK